MGSPPASRPWPPWRESCSGDCRSTWSFGQASQGRENRLSAPIWASDYARLLPLTRSVITTDLHPLLHANAGTSPAILVIAGTGSSVLAQSVSGKFLRLGGRGNLIDDEGSAYHIAISALQAAARSVDELERPTALVAALTEAAGLSNFEDFPSWAAQATKRMISDLAKTVAQAAEAGDDVARDCIERQARLLAAQVMAAARRLGVSGSEIPVFMHGGVFSHCELFRGAFQDALRPHPGLRPTMPAIRGHQAVYRLSRIQPIPDWLTVVSPEPLTRQ